MNRSSRRISLTICILSLSLLSDADDNIVRIEEKLTTDKEFYEQWMHLVGLQAQEREEQDVDFPIETENKLEKLANCRRTSKFFADHVDYLRPEDVLIYAEMGHLGRYCHHNYSSLQAGILDSCQHRGSELEILSIDKMLRVFSPNLTVIDSNSRDAFLTEQARVIADSIEQIEDYEDKWKLIMVMPNIQDGEATETGQTAVEVLATIEEFEKRLPKRTLLFVVESSGETDGKGIWQDASHAHSACRQMLSKWKLHTKYNSQSVWDQVTKISSKNHRNSNFSVEFLPLLKNASLMNLPDAADLSVLGYDCAHFSSRGLSLFHLAVWNSLFTRSADRSRQYRAEPREILCPDPRCPFIRTQTNSVMCIWNEIENWSSPLPPELIAVAVLMLAVLLAIIVVVCVCLSRRHDRYPIKSSHAFGSNFSSIRFIDEDEILSTK